MSGGARMRLPWTGRAVPLGGDSSTRYLPWIIAPMVFLAMMALASAIVVGRSIERWDRGLAGTMTVQIPAAGDARAIDQRVQRALVVLNGTSGIIAAEPVSREKAAALIEPWLGPGAAREDLPIPRLIDARVAPGAVVNVPDLRRRIEAASPGAVVDDHHAWLDRLARYARWIEAAAVVAVGLVAAVAAATIVFATLTRLAIHRDVIELLGLIGATDRFVARQFELHAFLLGLGGGLVGGLPAALALAAVNRAAAELAEIPFPLPTIDGPDWLFLALIPLATGAIAILTARITVLRALRSLARAR